MENNELWIHPLIRNVLKRELKPTSKDCAEFLSELWRRLDERYPLEKRLAAQAAEVFEQAAEDFGEKISEYYAHAGYCYIVSEQYAKAMMQLETALNQDKPDNSDINSARIYNDTGVAAFFTQNYEKGMTYMNKALEILSNVPEDNNVGNIFANLSNVHIFLGDYEKAEELGWRAVAIFNDKYPIINSHEKANAHSIYGNALMWTKKFEEAIEQFHHAENILKALTPQGSVDIARIYFDLGQVHAEASETGEAVTYLLKAIRMQKKFLPRNHQEIITSYQVLSAVYRQAGEVAKSKRLAVMIERIRNEEKTKRTRELLALSLDMIELFGENMSDIDFIKKLRLIGEYYLELGDFPNAQKFIDIALERSRLTNKFDAMTFSTAADIFTAQKKFGQAVQYARKSLALIRREEPLNFSNLSAACLHLGDILTSAQILEEALSFFSLSISYQEQCQYPERDFIKIVKLKRLMTLKELNRLSEATLELEELLREWRSVLPDNHPKITELGILLQEFKTLI